MQLSWLCPLGIIHNYRHQKNPSLLQIYMYFNIHILSALYWCMHLPQQLIAFLLYSLLYISIYKNWLAFS